MRLTSLTDFSLRMLMHVAQHPDRLCTIAEVAQIQRISQTHLMKVTHQLALQGWLTTVRGKGGGIRLAMPPEKIGIGAVVRSIEPSFAIVECFSEDNTGCRMTGSCRLANVFDGALQAFLQHLDRYTLADMLPGLPALQADEALPIHIFRTAHTNTNTNTKKSPKGSTLA